MEPRPTTRRLQGSSNARWRSGACPGCKPPSITWPSCIERRGSTRRRRDFYKRALVIREKALGVSYPFVADTLNHLAWIYQVQGKYTEAEGIDKRALAVFEKVHGENHPAVAEALRTLAAIYGRQGKYSDAEALNKRALAITERALGSHRDVALNLNSVALVYRAQGKYSEAEGLYKRALVDPRESARCEPPRRWVRASTT